MGRLARLRPGAPGALEELAELEAAIVAAQAHADRLDLEVKGARRRREAARGPLLDHFRNVGAGRLEADAAVEAKLTKQAEAEEAKQLHAERAAEAKHAGALEALAERRQAPATFITQNRQRLETELAAEAVAAHDRLFAARDELYASIGEWSRVSQQFRRMLELWGETPSLVPPNRFGTALGPFQEAFAPLLSGEPQDPRRHYPCPANLAPSWEPGTGEAAVA